MGPLDQCSLFPYPCPLVMVLAICAPPIVQHPSRAPFVLALSDASFHRRRREAKADHGQDTVLSETETKSYVSKGTALCPPTGPPPTESSAVSQALKRGLFARTTARTPPPFTPLLPGLIAGGVGITLLPQRPWIPLEVDPKRGDRGTTPATTATLEQQRQQQVEEGEDPTRRSNVTCRLGSTAQLDCPVAARPNLTVTWLLRREDSIQLLTIGPETHSEDSRFQVFLEDPNNWRLQILSVMKSDEGIYECQTDSHPMTVKKVFLHVSSPELKIVDEDGNELLERHYKAGSEVKLTCIASHLQEEDEDGLVSEEGNARQRGTLQGIVEKILWRHGDSSISRRTSTGRSIRLTYSEDGRNASVVLTIHDIKEEDEGDYSCSLGDASSDVVRIKVIHGQNSRRNGSAPMDIIDQWILLWIMIPSLITFLSHFKHHLITVNT